jgi:hypothetical protein
MTADTINFHAQLLDTGWGAAVIMKYTRWKSRSVPHTMRTSIPHVNKSPTHGRRQGRGASISEGVWQIEMYIGPDFKASQTN